MLLWSVVTIARLAVSIFSPDLAPFLVDIDLHCLFVIFPHLFFLRTFLYVRFRRWFPGSPNPSNYISTLHPRNSNIIVDQQQYAGRWQFPSLLFSSFRSSLSEPACSMRLDHSIRSQQALCWQHAGGEDKGQWAIR